MHVNHNLRKDPASGMIGVRTCPEREILIRAFMDKSPYAAEQLACEMTTDAAREFAHRILEIVDFVEVRKIMVS